MNSIDVLRDLYGRGREIVGMVETLSESVMHAPPHPSIAWHVWRAGRSLDYNFAPLLGREQLWIADSWHERFGMALDPRDFQPGFPPPNEIVTTFRSPGMDLLLDYFKAAHALPFEYLGTIRDDDLDTEIDKGRYTSKVTIGIRVVSVGASLANSLGAIKYKLWVPAQTGV